MSGDLRVHEIYLSLQGESTLAGLPCIFIRLTACNLRCSYCDTAYAFTGGTRLAIGEILDEVERLSGPYHTQPSNAAGRLPMVELTGGEPLLQSAVHPLMALLCDRGWTVLVETSGALDISAVDPRVRRIMDLKCPSSGEVERNRWENLGHLRSTDELKFVIGTWEDYAWARAALLRHGLPSLCPILFSWVQPLAPGQQDPSLQPVPPGHTPIDRRALAEAILTDALPVRFQAQLHKVIWPAELRGV